MLLTLAKVFSDMFKNYPYYFNYFNSLEAMEDYHYNYLLPGTTKSYNYDEGVIIDKDNMSRNIFLHIKTYKLEGLPSPVRYYKILLNDKLIWTHASYFEEIL